MTLSVSYSTAYKTLQGPHRTIVEPRDVPLSSMELRASQRFKELLMTRFPQRVLQTRVYGSRARGDAHADSDLDVFVMVDDRDGEIFRNIIDAAWQVHEELELPFVISPFIVSRDHFEELIGLERRIAKDILTEGILL